MGQHIFAPTAVVHVDTNDIKYQQWEFLKEEYVYFVVCLLDTRKHVFISSHGGGLALSHSLILKYK